jgi:hypothetical protein
MAALLMLPEFAHLSLMTTPASRYEALLQRSVQDSLRELLGCRQRLPTVVP